MMAEGESLLDGLPRVPEQLVTPGALDAKLSEAQKPFVVRGLAAHWPLVEAATAGDFMVRNYLVERARPRSFPVNIGEPGGGDRLFYDAQMGMNFRMAQGPLGEIIDGILANIGKPDAPVIYLSSIDMDGYFDGLREENRLPLGNRVPIESVWIGGRTRIAAHNDVPHNLAICATGRRRFTLFPPEEFPNLYLGPLENTPAGRPVSMVDFAAPDFSLHPRFRNALECAQVADLAPGDAIFIPSLWWHHVEGLAPFNILVNYWWSDAPNFLGKPEDALFHAILALRDLPDADKARWRALFDHYVFANGAEVTQHLPPDARGILAPLTPHSAGQIRARLLRSLSR